MTKVNRKRRRSIASTKQPSKPRSSKKSATSHLTAMKVFGEFCATIAALRHPKHGCPWDLEQDHRTLRRYMLEEAYEAAETMAGNDDRAICEELGDVLLQVVLNAQIGKDDKKFDVTDVIRGINSKMRRRHPHVFEKNKKVNGSKEVRSQWEEIKKSEKKPSNPGVFSEVEHERFPALLHALKIGEVAHKIKFDWSQPKEVLAKLRSEIDELEAELDHKGSGIEEEMGDIFFTAAQLARHLILDPETTAGIGNQKFLKRFRKLESEAARQNIDLTNASQNQLEQLWNKVKAQAK